MKALTVAELIHALQQFPDDAIVATQRTSTGFRPVVSVFLAEEPYFPASFDNEDVELVVGLGGH